MMRRIRLLALCGAASALLSCSDNTAPTDSTAGVEARSVKKSYAARIELGTLGGNVSYANAINASGVVVGSAETDAGQTFGFRWTLDSGMKALSTLPGDDGSAATDIDDWGTILGVSFTGRYGDEGAVYHPVTWGTNGVIAPLVLPFTVPSGFDHFDLVGLPNALGQWAGTASPHPWCCQGDAVLFYSAATGMVNLRSLAEDSALDPTVIGLDSYGAAVDFNDVGTVLGWGGYDNAWRIFLWSPAAGFQLPGMPPGSDRVIPYGLNNVDEVVGWYGSLYDGMGAIRWSAKKGYTFLAGAGLWGYAIAINDKGEAVGLARPLDGTGVAAAWPRSGGIKMLATDTGQSSIALEINGNGLAVGWEGTSSGLDNHAMLWNTTLARVVPGSKARRGQGVPTAFEAKVIRCLSRPTNKLQRALCFAKD